MLKVCGKKWYVVNKILFISKQRIFTPHAQSFVVRMLLYTYIHIYLTFKDRTEEDAARLSIY